jgi:hypothetical protein
MNYIDIIRIAVIAFILYKFLNLRKETYNPLLLEKGDKRYTKVKDRQNYKANDYKETIYSEDKEKMVRKAAFAATNKKTKFKLFRSQKPDNIDNPVMNNFALHEVFDKTPDKFLDVKHKPIKDDNNELLNIRPSYSNGKCIGEINIKDIHRKLTEFKFEKLQVKNDNVEHTQSNHNGIHSFTKDHIKYINDTEMTTGNIKGAGFQAFDSDLQNIESVQKYYQNIENN